MPLDAQQINAVNRMLRELGRSGLNFYQSHGYQPWRQLARHHKAIANDPTLQALLPSSANMAGDLDGKSIPLVPSKGANNAAAFLRVDWDFNSTPWMLKYYIILYYGAAAGGEPQLGLSFRLEQPEGGGVHDYWHLQMCRRVAADRATEVRACHVLLPDSYPAFPLDASDAVSLTASIALAMSGRAGLVGLVSVLTGQGPIQTGLRKRYDHAIA